MAATAVLFSQTALALTTGNATWTPGSKPATVTWDGTQFILNDSLEVNSNARLRILDGNGNGGNFTLNLPDGGFFRLNQKSIIDLSGASGNGNGGNFIVNMAGSTALLDLRKSSQILSNGVGTGSGGIIRM